MSRIPNLAIQDMSPVQRRVYDAIASGPRGGVAAPFLAWLQSPELADKAQEFGAFCRFKSSLPPHLAELVILMAAAFWRAALEWNGHEPLAIKAGLSRSIIDAIRVGERPQFDNEDERVVWCFVTELLGRRKVTQSVWLEVQRDLGNRAAVEVIYLLGYYSLMSMTTNAFDIPPYSGPANPWEAP
jgi:4-carboxymuconolactone decarboxylase